MGAARSFTIGLSLVGNLSPSHLLSRMPIRGQTTEERPDGLVQIRRAEDHAGYQDGKAKKHPRHYAGELGDERCHDARVGNV